MSFGFKGLTCNTTNHRRAPSAQVSAHCPTPRHFSATYRSIRLKISSPTAVRQRLWQTLPSACYTRTSKTHAEQKKTGTSKPWMPIIPSINSHSIQLTHAIDPPRNCRIWKRAFFTTFKWQSQSTATSSMILYDSLHISISVFNEQRQVSLIIIQLITFTFKQRDSIFFAALAFCIQITVILWEKWNSFLNSSIGRTAITNTRESKFEIPVIMFSFVL